MKNVQTESNETIRTVNGYKIERSYGSESMKNCMLQIIRMVVAQNLQQGQKSVL